ncbi:MAG: molybdopterin-guanine dinucleotide biosynthesis protein B, partial [Parvimonas sp.]|nr:molybdopterin-guanine dinucleotide biosynthesis protein B [Parvimonas sp.]
MKNRAVSIVGECSNVGKTTLIKHLLEIFSKEGLKVGVVKHHHKEFDFDREGKDSFIFSKSGASCVKMVSPNRVITIENLNYEKSLYDVLETMTDYDFVLVEG